MGKKKNKDHVNTPAALVALVNKCDSDYANMQACYADLVKSGIITVSDKDPDGKLGTKKFVDSNVKFIRSVDKICDFIAAMAEDNVCGVCSHEGISAEICDKCALNSSKTMNNIYFNPKDGWDDNLDRNEND